MTQDSKIWFDLAWRVVKLYCPQLKQLSDITVNSCRSYLLVELSNYWNISVELLTGEQSFYQALKGQACSSAMKEMFAIFYYTRVDKSVASQMPKLFLFIAHRERVSPMPFYDRFVEEYTREHAKPPPAHPRPARVLLKGCSAEEERELFRFLEKKYGKGNGRRGGK
jgi:hypothetical protein